MYKRLSIRLVSDLSEDLSNIAQKRGLSINALISEMAWEFVENWKAKYANIGMEVKNQPSKKAIQ